jgi:hypothetical protein
MGSGVDANAWVEFCVVVGNVEGGVGGAVVPDQKLEVGVGLGEDTFDRFGEVLRSLS